MKAMIFDIIRNSYVDGPGIRTAVFFKGCNLKCAWCHNPESQSPQPQMMFYRNLCTGCGKCKAVCKNEICTLSGRCTFFCPSDARKVCGKTYTPEEVLEEVSKDILHYVNSNGGVTFSGGECMLQIDFLAEILKKCKDAGIHTAVDTAGHVPYEHFERILEDTDLFLYDIKCFDREKHRQYTGATNDRILENLKRLLAAGAKVWIRIPVIPGFNDTLEEMHAIRAFLNGCGKPEKVELLPYHAMGENKYQAIGRQLQAFRVPDAETMTRLNAVFSL